MSSYHTGGITCRGHWGIRSMNILVGYLIFCDIHIVFHITLTHLYNFQFQMTKVDITWGGCRCARWSLWQPHPVRLTKSWTSSRETWVTRVRHHSTNVECGFRSPSIYYLSWVATSYKVSSKYFNFSFMGKEKRQVWDNMVTWLTAIYPIKVTCLRLKHLKGVLWNWG